MSFMLYHNVIWDMSVLIISFLIRMSFIRIAANSYNMSLINSDASNMYFLKIRN